ncbi:Fe-S cluster assembly protein SufD [Kineosporia sp. J2-2]|uniref:Fe-S cluster assembly protein SufD n=1 Tax=Kineosporia corallincola TaxID=2835133 RepID=A0ABS5TQZ4_9ACTN|nr:Fe-S cluster assembly protein SufD [Kineosporia corallincola]MBT0772419.1 Fe-S cluster assembly protein SufD [Kineosporia corallincola]
MTQTFTIEGGPVELHRSSFDVADFPLPNGREEDWRFTPLDRLRGLLEGEPTDATLTWTTDLPEGVELTTVGAGDPLLRSVPKSVDRTSVLALENAKNGAVVVRVPRDAEPDRPVVIRLHGTGDQIVWGHVILDIGANAQVSVVVEHTGSARYSGELSILVGDGARVKFVSVQGWDRTAVHAQHVGIRLGKDASINSTQVTLGGDLVRFVETVEYTGPGGDAEMAGLYIADAGQHQEHRLFVDHSAPKCRSNVTYKGALQGEGAHTVWVGDVLIRAEAEGTDTYEMNRNLVLTDGTRADSVPNLEIETGEIVGAGHASTTGRFDDEQLFYLQARGITEEEARRLVVRGFFAELIHKIGIPDLQERLLAAIEAELGGEPETAISAVQR